MWTLSVRLNQTQRARMLRTRRFCTHRQFLKLESSTRIAIGGGGNDKEKIAVGSRPKMPMERVCTVAKRPARKHRGAVVLLIHYQLYLEYCGMVLVVLF